jgi:DNA-directed RNA polymerase subunit M/transcription elongation factor TFIIS
MSFKRFKLLEKNDFQYGILSIISDTSMDEESKADILKGFRENPDEIFKIMRKYDSSRIFKTLEEIEDFFFPEKKIEARRSTIYKCKKCRSNNIFVEQQQIRSTDEGATTIYTCRDCGNSWND